MSHSLPKTITVPDSSCGLRISTLKLGWDSVAKDEPKDKPKDEPKHSSVQFTFYRNDAKSFLDIIDADVYVDADSTFSVLNGAPGHRFHRSVDTHTIETP